MPFIIFGMVKLRKQGYRLVYSVEDGVLVVLVLSVGKRENMAAYLSAARRLPGGELRPYRKSVWTFWTNSGH